MLNQTYNDAVVQSRVKSQTLGTIARYLVMEEQMLIVNKSQLIRVGLELLEKILVTEKNQPRMDVDGGREVLTRLGIDGLNTQQRNQLNYVKEMQLNVSKREGDWEEFEPTREATRTKPRKEVKDLDPEWQLAAQDATERLAEEAKQRTLKEKIQLGNVEGAPVVEDSTKENNHEEN